MRQILAYLKAIGEILVRFEARYNRNNDSIERSLQLMTTNLNALQQEIALNTSEVASAAALMNGLTKSVQDLKAEVAAANPDADLSAIDAFAAQLQQNNAALAAALTANTPSDPNAPTQAPAAGTTTSSTVPTTSTTTPSGGTGSTSGT